ncbi:type II toxin-antitoxin system VapC family toxin [Actinocrinis sp.]|uniref:type II toxin-antitoxin system VapC family toxin n=1 Tax=Actinocrinis sp. TaxID=1920516 RepID=UPI002D41597F|nr:type II toxin-antitoxin system VapC family toxin [Actinocrinis sp.]HZP50303.1 type II toxin-antitoxin system VapC family toxin [Actinocrinis sp.]HZU56498.1 type II toxin-antitoxin system VapC family toxin [Actinocrinis sp.]
MPAVVLDSDVSSLIVKGKLPPPMAARLVGWEPCITFVTYGELTQWVRLRLWGTRRQATLAAWLSAQPVINGDADVATVWGQLSARAVQDGRPRPTNDSWIAACCLTYGLPLATFNVKDFAYYVDHHGLRVLSA